MNWKVTGSIPSQGTCLGFRPGLWLGMCKRQWPKFLWHIDVFLPLSLPLSLFLKISKNKTFKSKLITIYLRNGYDQMKKTFNIPKNTRETWRNWKSYHVLTLEDTKILNLLKLIYKVNAIAIILLIGFFSGGKKQSSFKVHA